MISSSFPGLSLSLPQRALGTIRIFSVAWFQTVKDWVRVCNMIMGLATIDLHSRKVQTKPYKILTFGVNRPNSKQGTAIWKCKNLQRNVWPSGRCPNTASGWPHTFLCSFWRFLHRCISVKTGLIKILWISVCSFWLCGSTVAYPIIYRLVPSPFRFEMRQWCKITRII